MDPIMSIWNWPTNAEMIADCARLGYLDKDASTLDPTYGYGTFWKLWRPDFLVASDLDVTKSPIGYSIDFTNMPFPDQIFQNVVFDPPFKLNGTPTVAVDERYGAHHTTHWQTRMNLIRDGITESARVLGDGYLLLKCQDQVHAGKVRWQTIEFTVHAATCGLGLVDRLDRLSYRPQPLGRRQVHARRNSSTLLIFKRGYHS